ncbi:RDD family protein [Wolbachia endosymbiont of Pentidionis agamae]|uniref:RDD family protein n=1 Tax=Wolbachia endosymbiont of Pentidionis agamae TaxID=3110435 RepID=UPI002FD05217
MDTKYAGITRRVIAGVIDAIIIIVLALPIMLFQLESNKLEDLLASLVNEDIHEDEIDRIIHDAFLEPRVLTKVLTTIVVETIFLIILETFLITKFGGTPGYLLLSIRIKDANTFKNVSIIQAVVRCVLIHIIGTIISLFPTIIEFTTLIILIVLAVFDKRKQFLHDKIAKTVAIMHLRSNS